MDPRTFITFEADFPDDAQWDEQENLVVPSGQTIAQLLRNLLQAKGISCSEVSQHSHYGWDFDAVSQKVKAWCLLAAIENRWLLQLERRKTMLHLLFGPPDNSSLEELQNKFHDILTDDTRFSNVLWYTRVDFENGKNGSPAPRCPENRPENRGKPSG